ncbi:MAG: alpha/beta hydrolase [Paracoccaceae bacterium]
MRILIASLTALILVLPATGRPVQAQTQPTLAGPALFSLLDLAETDPAAAVGPLDTALAEMQASPTPDMRTFFDLALLRAEVAVQLEAWGDAAALYGQLAQAAESTPALDEDPVQLWAQAADAAEQAGDLRGARQALRQRLSLLAERTPEPAVLADAYEGLARVAEALGDQADADRNRAQADASRAAPARSGAPSRSDDAGFRTVEVYYATDRARTGETEPNEFYGGGRSDGLDLGIATVTVPNQHTPGMMERPSIWRLEFSANPAKHVVLQSVTPVDADSYFGKMRGEFADGGKSEAFVFVHGYNVAFDQAARRAAQIAVDMDYPVVPILYSWPSRGKTIAYVADTAAVRLSGRRLSQFLDELTTKSGARTIHIVAHSMGNRALTDALELLALKRQVGTGDEPLFGQILFAAPDVDAGLFQEMIRTIRPLARRLTLYASEQDWALTSSRALHGNAPRAGQGGSFTLKSPDIDSIDMSELGEDMLAHSYFADDKSALADMVALFWRNADPARRCGLERVAANEGGIATWLYRQGECDASPLISAISHMREAQVETVPEALVALDTAAQDPQIRSQLAPVISKMLE